MGWQLLEEEKRALFAATYATSRNVPAVTASLISEQISIDFVREGTGKLIFRRQYPRELVERVCKERDLTAVCAGTTAQIAGVAAGS